MELVKRNSKPCAYLRIASDLRSAIESGEFPAGCRMPTVGELAERFSTSVFTIQSALKPLEREGLIEQKRRVGIFVKSAKARLETLGIYYGRKIWNATEMDFYRALHAELELRLEERGVKSELFIDARPPEESGSPFQPLIQAIEQGRIQALAGAYISYDRCKWLGSLRVPKAFFTARDLPGRVFFETEKSLFEILKLFKARGRKRPAIICNIPSLRETWFKASGELGMRAETKWMRISDDLNIAGRLQTFGYESFLSLWAEAEKPDCLFIYPDMAARGVLTGMLSLGAKVPEELLVAMHRNENIDFPCPFSRIELRTSAKDAAQAMLSQIAAGMRGESQEALSLEQRIVED